MLPRKHIGYYRVSTGRQGRSGLGLEAQQQTGSTYLNRHAGNLVATYTDVDSTPEERPTGRSWPPRLITGAASAPRSSSPSSTGSAATLPSSIARLMESRVDFVCCDNPHANRLMLHLLAAFAEHEREQISLRTKTALQAAKAGRALENPELRRSMPHAGRRRGVRR